MNNILNNKENSAIQKHIDILQNIISRMSSNSASCKTWSFGLVGAMLALFIESGKVDCLCIAIIPSLLFYIADSYYVSLERDFRTLYTQFVSSINDECIDNKNIFVIQLPSSWKHRIIALITSMFSFSTVIFYMPLIITIIVIQIVI
ncbi:hypothetical protein [Dysgonomonas macrotermitis]|uniref:Uncharacterized protein n=1 Tax=Dysgonomonas macrotermitis TaxID=1346286 RepID=A0A1M5DCS4_9BACT|nr:hypothetical protein [Dysgonomonas macrotermitis]SHF64750.1 hypothetical protein SAMN05444362_108152 [Dysgonomonas macrotermitis]